MSELSRICALSVVEAAIAERINDYARSDRIPAGGSTTEHFNSAISALDGVIGLIRQRAAEAPVSETGKNVPADLWDEIVEFIEDHVDVVDSDDGRPAPNTAMHLSSRIEQEVK